MSKIKELIIATLLPAIKTVGKIEMEAVLSGIKEQQPGDVYKNILQALFSNFSLLKEAAIKSRSKIDDGIIDLVLDAVKENAAIDGITLT